MKHPDPAPDPTKHAELYAKTPQQLAQEMRTQIDGIRDHMKRDPGCEGEHQFRCGHLFALRVAEVLDEFPEGDGMFLGYGQLEKGIESAPITYLPALLITIVKRCVKDGVFQPGKLAEVVAKTELQAMHPTRDHSK